MWPLSPDYHNHAVARFIATIATVVLLSGCNLSVSILDEKGNQNVGGKVTSLDGKINCPSVACTFNYSAASYLITIVAKAANGYSFVEFEEANSKCQNGAENSKLTQSCVVDVRLGQVIFVHFKDSCPGDPMKFCLTGHRTNNLSTSSTLASDEYLESLNGRFRLTLTTLGDLEISETSDSNVLWQASVSDSNGNELKLIPSGNLVLSGAAGTISWQTETQGTRAARLVLKDDASLELWDSSNNVVQKNSDRLFQTVISPTRGD